MFAVANWNDREMLIAAIPCASLNVSRVQANNHKITVHCMWRESESAGISFQMLYSHDSTAVAAIFISLGLKHSLSTTVKSISTNLHRACGTSEPK